MSLNVGVIMGPLKWPIAPDGYIPNSVIRSLLGKGKEETKEKADTKEKEDEKKGKKKMEGRERADEEEDKMDRLELLKQYYDSLRKTTLQNHLETFDEEQINVEPQRQEKTNGVKKTKEREDEKNEKDKEGQNTVEGMERADERKEKEEDKMDRIVLMKQSYNIQTKTSLQNHLKTFDDEKINMEPQRQEVSSTYSSRMMVNFTPASCYENGPKQLRELGEDMKLHETITPPLQSLTVPNKQRTSSFIPKEPRITLYVPPMELKNMTPHPLKPPPPTPEDPQPQLDLGPPECLPIRDKRSLLLSTKYNNIRDQVQVPLDRKVLELFKKLKASNKNSSHPRKLSTTAERPPASKATHSTVQTNTGGPECPSHPPCSDYPAQFAQTILPIKGQGGQKAMPEWRKSLCKHQPGQAAVYQRVVQKIQMTETLEPASSHFHLVIPMASRHNFFTLNRCGKTRYGRLQFDWVRGSEEDRMLKVSGVKIKDPAVTKL